MTKKNSISATVLCLSIGLGATLYSLWRDENSSTAPPQNQPQASVRSNRSAESTQKVIPTIKQSPFPANADSTEKKPSYPPRPQSSLEVDVRHGEVTLRAENQSLKKVLATVAEQSGIQINAQLIADRELSMQLVRVPLDRALRTILEFEDSFMAFENQTQANAGLKAVWVLPSGTGGTWPPRTIACTREISVLAQQLTAEQASQRAEALDALIDLQGPDAAQTVVQSLRDHDDDVRYRALLKAHAVGLALPPETLATLVQQDRSELVRMMAIESIANHPAIDEQNKVAFAQSAIRDVSPAVQTRAGEILSHLESAPLMHEQDQALYDEAEGQ